jgi:coproporphyrinogen III oxidase-like Fe-S oxidoreductase
MNGFRLCEGFSDQLFEERTGESIRGLEQALSPLEARGLVERTPGRWRATAKGLRFLNEILVKLLPEPGHVAAP